MAHNLNKPNLTGNDVLTATLGAAGLGLTAKTTYIAGKEYKRGKINTLSGVRRDYAEGIVSRPEAQEICRQEGISPKQCLAADACEVKRNADLKNLAKKKSVASKQTQTELTGSEQTKTQSTVSDKKSESTGVDGGSRKGNSGLRGGGSKLHGKDEPYSNFNSDLNRNDDSLESSQEHYVGSESVENNHTASYSGRRVANDTFVGVDPDFSFAYNDGNSRFTPSVPFIVGGLFFTGFLYFKSLQRSNTWVKRIFPDETQLIIENQIKMENKLDKIHELQEKINKNLT